MVGPKNPKVLPARKPNFVSHKSHCTVCAHTQREEIEQRFILWESPAKIAAEYKLKDRSAVYRHAHAVGLFPKRDRNLRAVLGRLIERIDEVEPTAGAAVQAIALYARLNARGEIMERGEQEGLHDLFAKMNLEECEAYAKHGTLPSWFHQAMGTEAPTQKGGNQND
jgi:hypothetical protein